jgi:hypothetical protein
MVLHRVFAPVVLGALALSAVPAAAEEPPFGRMAEDLSDPARQDAMAGALEALGEALLDLKVGPFMKAMDRAGHGEATRDIDPDATLADVAGPEARRMPRELADKLPVMMGLMGSMAGELEAMLPELEAMGRKLERRMEGAMGEAARRERRRRD